MYFLHVLQYLLQFGCFSTMNMPRAEAGARLLPLLLLAAYSLAAVQALTLAGDQLKDFNCR